MQQGVFTAVLAVCVSQGCLTCPGSSALAGDHEWEVRLSMVMLRRALSTGITPMLNSFTGALQGQSQVILLT